jgi:hypothetical protein
MVGFAVGAPMFRASNRALIVAVIVTLVTFTVPCLDFLLPPAAFSGSAAVPGPLRINLFFDRLANDRRGLLPQQLARIDTLLRHARSNYARSSIDLVVSTGTCEYHREPESSVASARFSRGSINVVVTDRLGYDIDHQLTGAVSFGPPVMRTQLRTSPFFLVSFIGLEDAAQDALEHEIAHHLAGHTLRRPGFLDAHCADAALALLFLKQRLDPPVELFQRGAVRLSSLAQE